MMESSRERLARGGAVNGGAEGPDETATNLNARVADVYTDSDNCSGSDCTDDESSDCDGGDDSETRSESSSDSCSEDCDDGGNTPAKLTRSESSSDSCSEDGDDGSNTPDKLYPHLPTNPVRKKVISTINSLFLLYTQLDLNQPQLDSADIYQKTCVTANERSDRRNELPNIIDNLLTNTGVVVTPNDRSLETEIVSDASYSSGYASRTVHMSGNTLDMSGEINVREIAKLDIIVPEKQPRRRQMDQILHTDDDTQTDENDHENMGDNKSTCDSEATSNHLNDGECNKTYIEGSSVNSKRVSACPGATSFSPREKISIQSTNLKRNNMDGDLSDQVSSDEDTNSSSDRTSDNSDDSNEADRLVQYNNDSTREFGSVNSDNSEVLNCDGNRCRTDLVNNNKIDALIGHQITDDEIDDLDSASLDIKIEMLSSLKSVLEINDAAQTFIDEEIRQSNATCCTVEDTCPFINEHHPSVSVIQSPCLYDPGNTVNTALDQARKITEKHNADDDISVIPQVCHNVSDNLDYSHQETFDAHHEMTNQVLGFEHSIFEPAFADANSSGYQNGHDLVHSLDNGNDDEIRCCGCHKVINTSVYNHVIRRKACQEYYDMEQLILFHKEIKKIQKNLKYKENVRKSNKKKKSIREIRKKGQHKKTHSTNRNTPLIDLLNNEVECDGCGKVLKRFLTHLTNSIDCREYYDYAALKDETKKFRSAQKYERRHLRIQKERRANPEQYTACPSCGKLFISLFRHLKEVEKCRLSFGEEKMKNMIEDNRKIKDKINKTLPHNLEKCKENSLRNYYRNKHKKSEPNLPAQVQATKINITTDQYLAMHRGLVRRVHEKVRSNRKSKDEKLLNDNSDEVSNNSTKGHFMNSSPTAKSEHNNRELVKVNLTDSESKLMDSSIIAKVDLKSIDADVKRHQQTNEECGYNLKENTLHSSNHAGPTQKMSDVEEKNLATRKELDEKMSESDEWSCSKSKQGKTGCVKRGSKRPLMERNSLIRQSRYISSDARCSEVDAKLQHNVVPRRTNRKINPLNNQQRLAICSTNSKTVQQAEGLNKHGKRYRSDEGTQSNRTVHKNGIHEAQNSKKSTLKDKNVGMRVATDLSVSSVAHPAPTSVGHRQRPARKTEFEGCFDSIFIK